MDTIRIRNDGHIQGVKPEYVYIIPDEPFKTIDLCFNDYEMPGTTISIDGGMDGTVFISHVEFLDMVSGRGMIKRPIMVDLPNLLLICEESKSFCFEFSKVMVATTRYQYEDHIIIKIKSLLDIYLKYSPSPVVEELIPLFLFQAGLSRYNTPIYDCIKTESSKMILDYLTSFNPIPVKEVVTINCLDGSFLTYPILSPISIEFINSNILDDRFDMLDYSIDMVKLAFDILYSNTVNLTKLLNLSYFNPKLYITLSKIFDYMNIKFYSMLFHHIIENPTYKTLLLL